ncbi:DUF2570 domain-containing protein [Glaesserella parasuis]|nr:DUF2570 domain-containing protein [Glaesserella parasuis]MCT8593162.1 DUF2570 domain-containing protein [Glaesserella parasuis]
MFSWVNKILMALILGLCAWLWGQSRRIDSLKAESQTQAQTRPYPKFCVNTHFNLTVIV